MFKKKTPQLKTIGKSFLVKNNEKIYKYLSLDKFLHLLEKRTLCLVQVDKYWEDPYEGVLVDSEIQGLIDYFKKVDNISLGKDSLAKDIDILNKGLPLDKKDAAERTLVQVSHWKKLVHGTSWSLNPESDAMWRIYSSHRHGIQIQSTVGKLKGALKNVQSPDSWIETYYTVGKVSYELPTNNHIHLEEQFLYKGKAFKHELEVRGIVQPIHPHRAYSLLPEPVDFINAKIAGGFIEKVVIDPRAEDWFVDAVTSYCKKENISKCTKSKLYTKPSFCFSTKK